MSTKIDTKNYKFVKMLEYEQLLNDYSGKRYHISSGNDLQKFSLILINKNKIDKVLVSDLNVDQMLRWIQRHLVVDIVRD